MDTLPFRFIWLGQTILKYQVPLDIFNVLNGIYETNLLIYLMPINNSWVK